MAGNNKRSTDRRDSLKQQHSHQHQRKPIAGRPSKDSRNTKSPASPASPASTAPSANTPTTPSSATHRMGINGFNTSDVQGFLNGRFADMIKVMQDPNVDASSRPEKYESQEKAWGSKGGLPSVWGQKNGAMASGADFLSELVQRAK